MGSKSVFLVVVVVVVVFVIIFVVVVAVVIFVVVLDFSFWGTQFLRELCGHTHNNEVSCLLL